MILRQVLQEDPFDAPYIPEPVLSGLSHGPDDFRAGVMADQTVEHLHAPAKGSARPLDFELIQVARSLLSKGAHRRLLWEHDGGGRKPMPALVTRQGGFFLSRRVY